jgi:hypothetical protein
MNDKIEVDKILSFAMRRNITNLFKDFLDIVKELKVEHQESLSRLSNTLPEEYKANVYLADHFSDEKNERVRKTILSKGNDCIRNIEEQMNHFDIRLKK